MKTCCFKDAYLNRKISNHWGAGLDGFCWIGSVPNPSASSKASFPLIVASLACSYGLKEAFSFSLLVLVAVVLDFFVGVLGAKRVSIGFVRWQEKKIRPGETRRCNFWIEVHNRNSLSRLHCCWMQTNLKIKLLGGTEDSAHSNQEHRQILSQPAHRRDWIWDAEQ